MGTKFIVYTYYVNESNSTVHERAVYDDPTLAIGYAKRCANDPEVAHTNVMDCATGEVLYYKGADGSEYTATGF